MKTTLRFALTAVVFGTSSALMADTDCQALSVSVEHSVAANQAELLQIVEREIAANPGCACEVVKAAIKASEADAAKVAAIVEVAASAAPEHMRLIAQCAVAMAPDSLSDVQSVMARLDPNKGEVYSSKEPAPKAPMEPAPPAFNPLDFPGSGPVSPGGYIVPVGPPGFDPGFVPINPDPDTEPNFGYYGPDGINLPDFGDIVDDLFD